jgi:hypothetical protein
VLSKPTSTVVGIAASGTIIIGGLVLSSSLSFFWILYALVSKFQIIASTILIEGKWPQALIDFATSFAGMNLHIPFPWSDGTLLVDIVLNVVAIQSCQNKGL